MRDEGARSRRTWYRGTDGTRRQTDRERRAGRDTVGRTARTSRQTGASRWTQYRGTDSTRLQTASAQYVQASDVGRTDDAER